MKKLFIVLCLLGLFGCVEQPAINPIPEYTQGWRYTMVDEKGYLCHEDKGCFVGLNINDYCDTPFGRLYWRGWDLFWNLEPDSHTPIGEKIG